MTKATEAAPGVTSAMRIIALIGTAAAVFLIVAGVILLIVETVGRYGSSNGLALAGLGLGMFSTGAVAKSWQAQAEAKVEAAQAGGA